MSDSLPSNIGKYQVRSDLGTGAFGRVFKAWDPQVGRLVAIKVLAAQGSNDVLARFQNDAAAAGNLRHENIVTIYEFGTYEGAPFIAMEYLDGADLHKTLAAGRHFSLLEKVRIMSQVGQGLKCAHESGVVHRDVKPANIMVQPNGLVKIIDFGIARLTREDATRLTQKGDLVGTIRYMSPEQFAGMDVDNLCDIFAYGVIYYELVAGKHPFEAPDVAAFMYKITESTPVPLGDAVPGCPSALQQIVMRALEKDRDLRYQSLEDLLLDMRPVLLDLQKVRAAELLTRTRELFETGEIRQAQATIREAVDLDSSNPEVWDLHKRIQQSAHRESVRPRVSALLKDAQSDLDRRLFQEAIDSLEAASKLDPSDPSIGIRLKEARRQCEGARQAERLLSDATREFSQENMTIAQSLATQALDADPANARARDLADAIRKGIGRRDNERRLKSGLDEARRLAAVEDFDAAIEKIERLKDLSDPLGLITALLARIRDQKAERERQERLHSEKQALRGILGNSGFSEALPRLESLCLEFPGDADLAALLEDTRLQLQALGRAEDLRNSNAQAAKLQSTGRFAEAEEVLLRLSTKYPDDSEIRFLTQEATRLRQDNDRRQKLAEILRTVAQLGGENRFEDAIKAVEDGLQDWPNETSLLETRKKLETESNSYRRASRTRQAIAAAQASINEGQYDAAIGKLVEANIENPHNPEVEQLLRQTREKAESRRLAHAVDQVFVQTRGLAIAGQFDEAIQLLRDALKTFSGDARLQELLDVISKQREEWRVKQHLGEVVQTATRLLNEKRFPETIQVLNDALQRHSGEPSLLVLLDRATAEWESAKRADALTLVTSKIESALKATRLDEATRLVQAHSAEWGAEALFIALRNQVEAAQRKEQRNRQVQEALKQIRALEVDGQWEAALKACRAAIATIPDEAELLESSVRIERQVLRSKRESEVARLSDLAHQAIALKDWKAAGQQLGELERRYPDETSLPSLKARLQAERRQSDLEQSLSAVENAIRRREWPAAEKYLAAASAIAASSPRIPEFRSSIDRGKTRDRALVDAGAALRKGRFEETDRLLQPLLSSDPKDEDALELLRQLRILRTKVETEQAVREGRRQAKERSKRLEFDQAIGILQALIERHGPQPDLDREIEQYSKAAENKRKLIVTPDNAHSFLDDTTNHLLSRTSSPELPGQISDDPIREKALHSRRPIWQKPLWMGLAALLAIGGTVEAYRLTHKPVPVTERPKDVQKPSQPAYIGLSTSDRGGQLQIIWHPESPAVVAADSGILVIDDSGGPQTTNLTTAQLRGGSFTYVRRSDHVEVALTIPVPGGQTLRETSIYQGEIKHPIEITGKSGKPPGTDNADVVSQRIGDLIKRGDWAGASREYVLLSGSLRNSLQLKRLGEQIKVHDDGAKSLANAKSYLQSDQLQAAEKEAQSLLNTEYRAAAQKIINDTHGKVEAFVSQVNRLLDDKRPKEAKEILQKAREAYPADPRWDALEARIREQEQVATPSPCPSEPPTPAVTSKNYQGDYTRTVTWNGQLPKGCSLVLVGPSRSTGSVTGWNSVPRVAGDVKVMRGEGIIVVQQPADVNNFAIKLRNDSQRTVDSIQLQWVQKR
jgi:serine/threonine protein kinase